MSSHTFGWIVPNTIEADGLQVPCFQADCSCGRRAHGDTLAETRGAMRAHLAEAKVAL